MTNNLKWIPILGWAILAVWLIKQIYDEGSSELPPMEPSSISVGRSLAEYRMRQAGVEDGNWEDYRSNWLVAA